MSDLCSNRSDQDASGARRSFHVWLGGLARSWFSLTLQEQWAVALVAGLILIGLSMRLWHAQVRSVRAQQPAVPAGVVPEQADRPMTR